MRLSFLPLLAATAVELVASEAVPASHILHERRDFTSQSKWLKQDRIQPHIKLPVRIGLKQNKQALAQAQSWLMDVSHPSSPKYAQHWTQDEIIEAFRPADDTVDKVMAWISETAGIPKHRITHTDNKAWLAFDAETHELESLLHTEYHEHHHAASGRSMITCDAYHIPAHLKDHIDYITPGVKGIQIDSAELRKRSWGGNHGGHGHGGYGGHGKPPGGWRPPKQGPPPHMPKPGKELETCDVAVTPACLQALYHFEALSPPAEVSANNSMGIFEEGDFYDQEVCLVLSTSSSSV